MSNYLIQGQTLTDIADAIREKAGVSAGMLPGAMPAYIRGIQTGSSDTTGIPNGIVTEAERAASSILSKKGSNAVTFIAMADMHEMGDQDHSDAAIIQRYRRANLNAGQAAKLISDKINLDFFAYLGDFAWGSTTTTIADGVRSIRQAREYIADVIRDNESFVIPGNHDPLAYSYTANAEFLNQNMMEGLIGTYRYHDFTNRKVRVICLNTADMSGASVTGNTSSERISGEQLKWFAQALDLSAKSDAADWGIIILSHHPLDWGEIRPAANCLAAYLRGENFSMTHNGVAVSYNFGGKNRATVIAQFHGHVHGFRVDYINDLRSGSPVPTTVKRIAIPNACYGRNNEYGQNSGAENNGIEFGEEKTYNKTDDSTGRNTAFCLVSIDLDKKVIYADCFGAGYDRIVSYGTAQVITYSVTNSLSNAVNSNGAATVLEGSSYAAVITAEDGYLLKSVTVTMGGTNVTNSVYSNGSIHITKVTGNIVIIAVTEEDESAGVSNLASIAQAIDSTNAYNGTGYKNGYRITEDGSLEFEKAEPGFVITGWIPYSGAEGKSIYVQGAQWDTAQSYCRLYFFDSTKRTIVAPAVLGSTLTNYFTVETLGEKYIKLTPISSLSGSIAYFRMSLVGVGKDLVITFEEQNPDSGDDVHPGNLIDTVGYSDNTRLSLSSGTTKTEAGYVTTGLIDLSAISGDIVIQTSGVDFRAANHDQCSIVNYSSSGAFATSDYLNAAQGAAGVGLWTRTFDASGNLTLTVPSGSTKIFRLCGYGSGAELAVTIVS